MPSTVRIDSHASQACLRSPSPARCWRDGSAAWTCSRAAAPALVPMNPMTAVLFLLTAVSLRLQVRPRPGTDLPAPLALRLARVAALAIVAVAALRLSGYALGIDIGIDQWLFADRLPDPDSGRAQPHGAQHRTQFLLPRHRHCCCSTGPRATVVVRPKRLRSSWHWFRCSPCSAMPTKWGTLYGVAQLYPDGAADRGGCFSCWPWRSCSRAARSA